jgi:hypothetical protein
MISVKAEVPLSSGSFMRRRLGATDRSNAMPEAELRPTATSQSPLKLHEEAYLRATGRWPESKAPRDPCRDFTAIRFSLAPIR